MGLAAVWFVGSLFCLLLACDRIVRFRRLIDAAAPATEALLRDARVLGERMGLSSIPNIVLAPGRIAPMLWTLTGPPRIVLPADLWATLDGDARSALLAHELAHYRRRDHWVRLLELAATVLFWWNPAVWFLRSRLRQTEEECCDAWVTWVRPKAARAYAASLVATMDFLADAPLPLPPVATGARNFTSIKRRLIMILHEKTPRSMSPLVRNGLLAVGALVLVLVPTAQAVQPVGPAEPAASDRFDRSDRSNGSDDSPYAEERFRLEVELALSEALYELLDDYENEIESTRRELRSAVRNEDRVVQQALLEIDMDQLVDEVIEGSSEVVRKFARDIDVATVVHDALASRNIRRGDVSSADLRRVRRLAEIELRDKVRRMERGIEEEIDSIHGGTREFVRELTTQERRTLADLDIQGLIDELIADAPEAVRLFAAEVDLPAEVDRALNTAR